MAFLDSRLEYELEEQIHRCVLDLMAPIRDPMSTADRTELMVAIAQLLKLAWRKRATNATYLVHSGVKKLTVRGEEVFLHIRKEGASLSFGY